MCANVVCSKCAMDTTAPDISFDNDGVCKFCKIHDQLEKEYPSEENSQSQFHNLITEIKRVGEKNEYDCIVGVSGGRDSTYTLYIAKKMGLRPLAVHFDNGWNSDNAVTNIKNATNKLDVDLYTVVADWEEFKDLQLAFLKASVPDAEIPTDYAISSILYDVASKRGIKYILNGCSFRTEGVAPLSWTYMDGKYIRSIHKKFGRGQISSFSIMKMSHLLYYILLKKIKLIHIPAYIEYNQIEIDEILKNKLNWKYYGGHHHESVFTEFFQSYYLPIKFNIDKRKLEYSALIRSGQMTREDALQKIQEPYPYNKSIVEYTKSKLGISDREFEEIMTSPLKSFKDYPSYYPIIKASKLPIKIACNLNLLPHVFYEKYLG